MWTPGLPLYACAMRSLLDTIVGLSALFACGSALVLQAQINSAAPTILQSVVLQPCAAATCGIPAGDGGRVLPPARSSGSLSGQLFPVSAAASGAGSTTFKSDATVSAQVRAIFLLSLERRLNGAASDAIARNMRLNDPMVQWSAMVGDQGMRAGDLADALASYWVLNWAMANGGESSGTAMQAVREQIRWAVANTPNLRQLTDAQKQAMAEEAMLNFVYEVKGYQQARQAGNGTMLGRFADGAERRFRAEMAVDLRSLTMTEHGLRIKR